MKINNKKVIYKGIFLDNESSSLLYNFDLENSLSIALNNLHITFEFKPSEFFPEFLLGSLVEVLVVGYGNNGKVEGFEVQLPDDLLKYYKNDSLPHITVYRDEDGKPKDTGFISFEPILAFNVYGYFGYFTGKEILYN